MASGPSHLAVSVSNVGQSRLLTVDGLLDRPFGPRHQTIAARSGSLLSPVELRAYLEQAKVERRSALRDRSIELNDARVFFDSLVNSVHLGPALLGTGPQWRYPSCDTGTAGPVPASVGSLSYTRSVSAAIRSQE